MKDLNWKQTDKIVIASAEINDKIIKFSIENKIINHLINNTPKVYVFKVEINNEKFDYIVDFQELKPVVAKAKKLSFKVKSKDTNEAKNVQAYGYYAIARGESFMERYLGIDGWQAQEYKFKIILLDEQNKPDKTVEQKQVATPPPPPVNKQKAPVVQKEIVKEVKNEAVKCQFCGNDISVDLDICPHCFKLLIPAEKDVDFAL